MITKLTLKDKWAERIGSKKQKIINFKQGVNLLVGPNGSGKSTIIEAITKHIRHKYDKETIKNILIEVDHKTDVNVKIFDFEKDNFRTKGYLDNNILLQLTSIYKSHGEHVSHILRDLSNEKIKDMIIILDEPDQSLDIYEIKKFINILTTCKAVQTIISVHNPLLTLSKNNFNIIELRKGYIDKMYESICDILNNWVSK